jgi:copper chaperone CopZ
MAKVKLTVTGVHCNSCKTLIQDILEDQGATAISIDLDAGSQTAKVECTGDKVKIIKALRAETVFTIK